MKKIYILFVFSLFVSCNSIQKEVKNNFVNEPLKIEVSKSNQEYIEKMNQKANERKKEIEFKETEIININNNVDDFELLRKKEIEFKEDKTKILEDSKHNSSKYSDENEYIYVFESGLISPGKKLLSEIEVEGINILNRKKLENQTYKNINHATNVLESLVNNNYSDAKTLNIRLGSFYDEDNKIKAKGFINMSYGWSDYYKNLIYLSKENNYIDDIGQNYKINNINRDMFSNLIFDKEYKKNRQLKVLALGNVEADKTVNYYNSTNGLLFYFNMSPELQKAARSESILVKNMYSDKEAELDLMYKGRKEKIGDEYYYEVENLGKNNSKPLALRSATVVHEGFLKEGVRGSSFSAPKVTRLAYEIKQRYPFLTYHQIKEIILTTASRESGEKEYLSNIYGWGVVNGKKALNGFSDFNAGLIEETKFFEGMNEKIYDKLGNIYQYIEIPKGIFEFSNDIKSGLAGNGENIDSDILNLTDSSLTVDGPRGNFRLNIPKVLDSEKNFYSNVKKAGLRKAGEGELILSGKQNYPWTQVLEGVLTLENKSTSKYDVFKKATLRLDKEAQIKNEVQNDGLVIINTDVEIDKYISTDLATTKFKAGKKITAKEALISGKIKIYFPEGEEIKPEYEIIKGKDIDISKIEFLNVFLDKPRLDNKVVKIGTGIRKKILELDEEKLRNIPSYNYNMKSFFEEYNLDDNEKYLLNITSENRLEAMSQIFTDNYATYLSNVLNLNNMTLSNIKKPLFKEYNKNNIVYYNSFISTNLVKDDLNTPFKNNIYSNSLGIDFKLYNNIHLGFFSGISNLRSVFENNADFISDKYNIGFKYKYKYKNLVLSDILDYSFVNSKVRRKIVNDDVYSYFKTHIINNMLSLGYEVDINNKHKLVPNIDLILTKVLVDTNKEIVNGENEKIGLEIKDNNLNYASFAFGFDWQYKINKYLTLDNNINLNFNIKDRVEINARLLDTDFKMRGKNLDKFLMSYRVGANIDFQNNFKIGVESSINTKGKWNNSFTLKYEF